ncbi:MAG: putative endonuclease [Patescibacteria group bacterium]|nr:putative endonuclease [Patescibacteria group bacterium]
MFFFISQTCLFVSRETLFLSILCILINTVAEHNEIGKIGEKIAISFLVKHGFSLVEKNYRTKYGEIDIIVKKDLKIRFVEVKSVKVRDFNAFEQLRVMPEDNFTKDKHSKVIVSAETYLNHKNISHETVWQVDLACVYINPETREGRVTYFENVSLD